MKRLDAQEGQADTEIVHAKFVLGADGKSYSPSLEVCANRITGAHSWVRKSFGIGMDGEQTGPSLEWATHRQPTVV